MLFHTFGNSENPTLLVMHGMMNDWKVIYEKMKPLEKDFFLIIPAMDGCYDGAKDFTTFADQCEQIEEYVQVHLSGRLYMVYGISQGATLMDELLSRDKIEIKAAILDGLYVAKQGKLAGKISGRQLLKMQKNGGEITPFFKNVVMRLMGMDEKHLASMKCIYWGFSKKSVENNMFEQYTYEQPAQIANTKAKIYLWCGSKEPYALKSHKIIKKYITNYEEEILPGCAHGALFFFNEAKLCAKIRAVGQSMNLNEKSNRPLEVVIANLDERKIK